MVTSPAPAVTITSPGRAQPASRAAAAAATGSNTASSGGSGTSWATTAPVTPGIGSSPEPGYTSSTTTASAAPSGGPYWRRKVCARE